MDTTGMGDWPYRSPFIEGPASLADQYADAAVLALLDGGTDLLSMRSIARRLGCTGSAVQQANGGKYELIQTIARTFGQRYRSWLLSASPPDWVTLPHEPDEMHGVRVWRALTDVGSGYTRAGRPAVSEIVARINASEAAALPFHLHVAESHLDTFRVPGVLACVRGIREAMAADVDPLDLESARAAIDTLRPQLTKRLVS